MVSLKVITCNIEADKHIEKLVPLLLAEAPDVVCLQEVLDKDVQKLKHALSMEGTFIPTMRINEENFVKFPVGCEWGVLVLTNQTLVTVSADYYVKHSDTPPNFGYRNPNATNRVLAVAEIKKENTFFRILTTHFTWTPDGNTSEKQKEDVEKMMESLERYPEFVLCGDFNAPRGGEIWHRIASVYKDNIPSSVLSTVDPIIHRVKDLQLVVDGVFSTPDYTVTDVKVVAGVSDHQAVIAMINK